MMLKVLILLCLAFYIGKTQENSEPNLTFNEGFVHLGPSSIHSIKGKFYEERQRKIISKPDNHNENVNKFNQSQRTSSNISNPELPRQNEKIIFRRNRDNEHKHSVYDIKKPILKAYNGSDTFKLNINNSVSEKLHQTQANNSNLSVLGSDKPIEEPLNSHFHAENLVSNYDKNNTMETIKKELAFDSLFIKNDHNNMSMIQAPRNIMNSYMSQEINPEAVIIDNPVELQVDEPNRRSATNAYNEPYDKLATNAYNELLPTDPFQVPIRAENIMPAITRNFDSTNDDNNLPNNINLPTTVPLRPTNYNVIDKRTCDDKESDEGLDRSGNDIQLQDPTKGFGISNVGKSRVMLMDHPRVCYACSSINDPSCWSPDRKTAVKYCRTDHISCLTKLHKYKGLSYVIRDCGNTCDQHASFGGPTKYTSCTICHHDLCNSAYQFKIQNVTILIFLMFHSLFVFNVSVN